MPVKLFTDQAIAKTTELTNYIKIITDTSTTADEAEKAIDLACGLFINEDAVIHVLNTGTRMAHQYKIRSYLNRLKLSRYDNVFVDHTSIIYVQRFRLHSDGNYYGVSDYAVKVQCFSNGLTDLQLKPEHATMVLRSHIKEKNGNKILKLDIFLSDASIKETEKR